MKPTLVTANVLALAIVFSYPSRASAGAFFNRNAFSNPNISDIPIPASSQFAPPPAAPPGATDGFAGSPEVPGQNGDLGGGKGNRGGDEGRDGQQENGQGDGKGGQRTPEGRERETRERETRERGNRDEGDKDRENRDAKSREREARDREEKAKDDNGKAKGKPNKQKRGTDSVPKSGGIFRERSGSNSDFKQVGRLAQAPSGSVSDMPGKYLNNRDYPPIPYWPIPATTIGTPSAHGADWTDVFAGVGLQNRARYGTLPNSTAIVGFGLGDAQRNVGMEVGLSSYGLIRHGLPFTTGGVSLKLHHYFADWQLGAAAGYENAIYWGAPDSGQSFFLVFSKYFLLGRGSKHEPFRTLFVHFGLGDGRFRNETDVRAGRNAISPFAAIAMRVADPVNMIANWTGSDLALGLSFTPFRTTPISFGMSALDILKQAGDGVRFSLVISYGDSVTNPTFPVSWWHENRPGR